MPTYKINSLNQHKKDTELLKRKKYTKKTNNRKH